MRISDWSSDVCSSDLSISFFIDFVCLPLWFSGLCKQWLRNHCGDDGQSDLHSISPHGSPPAHIISAVRLASTAVSSADGVTDGTASNPGTRSEEHPSDSSH